MIRYMWIYLLIILIILSFLMLLTVKTEYFEDVNIGSGFSVEPSINKYARYLSLEQRGYGDMKTSNIIRANPANKSPSIGAGIPPMIVESISGRHAPIYTYLDDLKYNAKVIEESDEYNRKAYDSWKLYSKNI